MIKSTIYCPISDAWATVIKTGEWYVARCQGKTRSFLDETQAFGWVERMLKNRAA